LIEESNINKILFQLDQALESKNIERTFTIFGSSALIIQGLASDNRTTVDIDIVDPEIDTELLLISMDISSQLGLEISWLNSAGYIFSKNFPIGWKDRTILTYKGSNLKVFCLSRKDLIASKFLAYCQRSSNTDFIDLTALAPAHKEIAFVEEWLMKRPDFSVLKENFYKTKTKLEAV